MQPPERDLSIDPRPELPKTIGVLNVVFGVLLLLCGMGCTTRLLPGLSRGHEWKFDPKTTQDVVDEMKRSLVADMKQQEDATSNEAEKARLRAKRLEIEAKNQRVEDEINFPQVNQALAWLPRYAWAEVTTGPLLNLLMLVSGVGLIRLKGWARVLGIWVAALKIVRLIALGVLLSVFVLPALTLAFQDMADTDIGRAILTKALEDQRAHQARNAPPPPIQNPKDFVELMSVMGQGTVIGYTCIALIYPIVALVVLTRPGARVACAGVKEPQADDLGLESRDRW